MDPQGAIFGRTGVRRALALLACVALLYFAAGGSLFHQHTNGPDTACHMCQALHMPRWRPPGWTSPAPSDRHLVFFAAAARSAERFLFSASRRARTSHRLIPHP